MDDEFDNFMERVTEIEGLVKQMRSPDKEVAERARRRADLLLGTGKDVDKLLEDGDGDGDGLCDGRLQCRKDRTVINVKAIERMGKADDPAEMSKEAFMAQVEKDAEDRARDKRERKQRSDEFKVKANRAFREKHFEKALDLYNKALEETRDSVVLYENRALTCLQLQLYHRALDDCNWALRLNENSLKALLYKARSLYWLKESDECNKCIGDALAKYPQHQSLINDYRDMWLNNSRSNEK